MALEPMHGGGGLPISPGGFEFGLQGWNWGEPRVKSITFFLDGTALVADQYGRPIKGAVTDNKVVMFATAPPSPDDKIEVRGKLGTHVQVLKAIEEERIDWTKLPCAGWPQLPYTSLKKMLDAGTLPPTPLEELRKIRDPQLRRDALQARREADEIMREELQLAEDE